MLFTVTALLLCFTSKGPKCRTQAGRIKKGSLDENKAGTNIQKQAGN